MVAPSRSARGRTRGAPNGIRPALGDRHGVVRRARPNRAGGDRREGAQADVCDAWRSHRTGTTDRRARTDRADESRDRREALPQPTNGGVAPPPCVREARDRLATGVAPRPRGHRGRPGTPLSARRLRTMLKRLRSLFERDETRPVRESAEDKRNSGEEEIETR